MATEIERKFLVDTAKLQLTSPGFEIKQGYLPMSDNDKTVARVRIKNDKAFLTIKGQNVGSVRPEFEYEIPVEDGNKILGSLCQKPIIEKTRYEIVYREHTWEVDVFRGENQGLVVAEIELEDKNEFFDMPPWALSEVTDDAKYYNSNLLKYPFNLWSESKQ